MLYRDQQLDIKLKAKNNGIDFARKIRNTHKNLYIIFTTAHLEYAFLAFQVKAFDYLPKPIAYDRLEHTLLRLFDDINCANKNFISVNNKTYINENDIYYIKRDGMRLVFKTNTNTYETYSSFNKLSSKLPHNFVRCHKSYIANVNNITCVEASRNVIMFGNNVECYIGPKYKNDLLEAISNEDIEM